MTEDASTHKAQEQTTTLFKDWLSGGLANGITSAILNPLDVTKTRIQASKSHGGILETMQGIFRANGIRGLWQPGLNASFYREMLSSGPRAGFYVPVRDAIAAAAASYSDGRDRPSSSFLVKILAAIITGTMGSCIANPVDVVKVRLMNDPTMYTSLSNGLYRLGSEEGLSGITKGLVPSVLRGAFISAGELATYDQAKSSLKELIPDWNESGSLHVTASLVTGVVATTVAAPFDLLKTRTMNSVQSSGVLNTLKDVVKNEGAMVLFRGWLPAYLRLGPHALICFPLLEQIRVAFGLSHF